MSKPNLLIAFGGISPEHEVSVITAIQAASAIGKERYNLIPLYISKNGRMLTGEKLLDLEFYKDLKKAEAEADPCAFQTDENGQTVLTNLKGKGWFSKPEQHHINTVLVAFHGGDGENGSFQGLCESYNLPYTGSNPMASSVGMDKRAAKIFAGSIGIPVVGDVFVTESEWIADKASLVADVEKLKYPVFVKPVHLGSSIGVQKASDREALEVAVETAFRFDDQLIVEKAVSPLLEVNCSVIGDADRARPSVCEQPLTQAELLSFEDKYMGDDGKGMASATRIIPAPIGDELTKKIQQDSVKLFRSLNGSGVARLDFLINKETNEYFFNEINTIPGSFSFYLWEKTELPFPALIQELIDIAQKRHQTKNGRVRSYETNLLSSKAAKGIKGLKGKG